MENRAKFCTHQPMCAAAAPCRQSLERCNPPVNTYMVWAYRRNEYEQISEPVTSRKEADALVSDYKRLAGIDFITVYFNGEHIVDYSLATNGKWAKTVHVEQVKRKPVKTVFTLSEIFHIWAHQTRAEGRTANKSGNSGGWYGSSPSSEGPSVFFEGSIIYSYGKHYPLAQIIGHGTESCYVLINSEKSTVSTERHKSDVRSACNQYFTFSVPYIDAKPDDSSFKDQHLFNIQYFEKQMKDCYAASKKSKVHALKHLDEYMRWQDIAWKYVEVTECKVKPVDVPLSANELKQAMIEARPVHEEYERKRYAQMVRSRALKELQWVDRNEYDRLMAMSPKERKEAFETVFQRMYALRRQADARRLEERRIREQEQVAKNAENIANWRSGGLVSSWVLQSLPAMLRIEGNEVATSKGARVSVIEARKALRFVAIVLSRCSADVDTNSVLWKRNGETCRVGHYQLDRILGDGTVHAGCHVISRGEQARLAMELNVTFPEISSVTIVDDKEHQ